MIELNKNEKQSNEELTKELIEYYEEKDPELAKILRDDIGLMQGDAIVVSFERVLEKTPSGADYSEIRYYNEKMMPCNKEKATKCVILEKMSL